MNKFVDKLTRLRILKGFFEKSLEDQVRSVIKLAMVLSVLLILLVVVVNFGFERIGGFLLLVLICTPLALLGGVIKSKIKGSIKSSKGGMNTDDI